MSMTPAELRELAATLTPERRDNSSSPLDFSVALLTHRSILRTGIQKGVAL